MEQASSKILGKIAIAILLVALVDLGFLNWWVVKNDKLISSSQPASGRENSIEDKQQDGEGASFGGDQITEDSQEVASPSPEVKVSTENAKTLTKTETVVQTAQKEIFIPLGSGSTTSQTYAELAGLQVTIEPARYTEIDHIVFEASVWIEGGNGRAWAQLYNVDDKTLLVESQISNPTGTGVLKASGKIPLPTGAKTYRVWAKSDFANYAAHVDNARMKIVLK